MRCPLIALYDGETAWTDKHVNMLLTKLAELGFEDNTLVILTSDHGEEFFEHDRFGHRKALFEESVAIPLIVRFPPRLPAGLRVPTPASVTDLVPTILAMVDVEVPMEVMGRPLLPWKYVGGHLQSGANRCHWHGGISQTTRERMSI